MRLLVLSAFFLVTTPALAANDMPEGVEPMLVCAHVYSLKSADAQEAGDEGAATEFFNMGDALSWQAKGSLESAGYTAKQIDNIDMNIAMMTGFNYGAGMAEELLANCLASSDSP
jgi:hypothetical protein